LAKVPRASRIGAGGGTRTHTRGEPNGILSPARLPVSPLRHVVRSYYGAAIYADCRSNRQRPPRDLVGFVPLLRFSARSRARRGVCSTYCGTGRACAPARQVDTLAEEQVTPRDLAVELGVKPIEVRRVLRAHLGTLRSQGRGKRWILTSSE